MLPFVSAALVASYLSPLILTADFEISPASFRIRSEGSAVFQFEGEPIRESVRNTPVGDVWKLLTVDGSPGVIETSTATYGFLARFHNGLAMRVKGIPPPYITWAEGSVGPGVPSQPSRWALLSWPVPQPPLLIVFRNKPSSLIAVETPDGFELQAEPGFQGWIEMKAPMRGDRVTTRRAADLGALLQKVGPVLGWMVNPTPRLREFSALDTGGSLSVTWQFDRQGAQIPDIALRAAQSKLIEIASKTATVGGATIADEASVTLRFSTRRLLPGIPVLLSPSTFTPPSVGMWNDYESTVNCALAVLAGNSNASFLRRLERLTNDSDAVSSADHLVQASQQLLRASLGMPTPHLGALEAALDPAAWQLAGADPIANAILAVAFSLHDRPEVRAWGAMVQASLRLSRAKSPLASLRSAIYAGPYPVDLGPAKSPIRVLTPRVGRVSASGPDLIVEGGVSAAGDFEFTLYSAETLRVAGKTGLTSAQISRLGNVWTLRMSAPRDGVWRVRLSRPPGSPALPAPGPSLGYSVAPR